jgi:hypothetical protein
MSPPMKTHRPSRRGAATSPARRSTGATCRGRPRRCLPVVPKCRCLASRRRPCGTRLWARARVRRLTLPKRTSERSALVWRPAGRVPPRHRDPHLARTTLQEGRRSGQRPPNSFSMALTAPTPNPCRGTNRGGNRRTQRRRRAHCRWWSQVVPRGVCSHCLSGVVGPRCSRVPCRWRGPQSNPGRRGG